MHPAFSVILLTTLIGVGQGLFLALYTGQVYSLANLLEQQDSQSFYALGSALALFWARRKSQLEATIDNARNELNELEV